MHHDRLDPHYIRGFIKECYDSGLTEDQTSNLLDEELKYHLAETNEHYRAGIKQAALEKQSNKLKTMLGLGGMAGGGALLGGLALNNAGEGVRNIGQNGVDLSLGIGKEPTATGNISGSTIGGILGGGLGLASMLRGKKSLRSLGKAMPFSKGIIQNTRTGARTGGYKTDLGKLYNNPKDVLNTAAHVGAGATAGALAPKVDKAMADYADSQKEYSTLDWLGDTRGSDDPIMPWYAGKGGTGQSDISGQIPNLSLLPQEVRQQALGGNAPGASGGRSGPAGSPNWAIDQAGQQIAKIDEQLAQQQLISRDPNASPMAREQAMRAEQAMTIQRDQAIAAASKAQKQMLADQSAVERKLLEERANAAARQTSLDSEAARVAQGPQRFRADEGLSSWLPIRGNMPSKQEHASEQQLIQDLILRNRERQYQLENSEAPQLISPEAQQILTQHGI